MQWGLLLCSTSMWHVKFCHNQLSMPLCIVITCMKQRQAAAAFLTSSKTQRSLAVNVSGCGLDRTILQISCMAHLSQIMKLFDLPPWNCASILLPCFHDVLRYPSHDRNISEIQQIVMFVRSQIQIQLRQSIHIEGYIVFLSPST